MFQLTTNSTHFIYGYMASVHGREKKTNFKVIIWIIICRRLWACFMSLCAFTLDHNYIILQSIGVKTDIDYLFYVTMYSYTTKINTHLSQTQ